MLNNRKMQSKKRLTAAFHAQGSLSISIRSSETT